MTKAITGPKCRRLNDCHLSLWPARPACVGVGPAAMLIWWEGRVL